MVIISEQNGKAIAAAVTQAEGRTSAEIAVVINPCSGLHADFLLLYGVVIATLGMLAGWYYGFMKSLPALLLLGLCILVFTFFTSFLRHLCWRFVPRHVLRRRSYLHALQEYHGIQRENPADLPFVLLFMSLGERYAHILASPAVYEKLSDHNWQRVMQEITKNMGSQAVGIACAAAVVQIGETLSGPFPENGAGNMIMDQPVINES